MKTINTFLLVVFFVMTCSSFSSVENIDPSRVKILTEDITNFWLTYDVLDNFSNKDSLIQVMYLDKGSPALKTYVKNFRVSATDYIVQIENKPDYWQSIRKSSLDLSDKKEEVILALQKLQEIYPNAIFPNINIFIGCFNFGGLARKTVWIGAEKLLQPNANLNLVALISHEYIHIQQKKSPNNLLGRTLIEGGADFIGEKICGMYCNNEDMKIFGDKNEEQLWKEFQKDLKSNNVNNWLNQGKTINGVPPDLAYYIGYKICESYYNLMEDKQQALIDIIEVKNYKKFLEESKYGLNF